MELLIRFAGAVFRILGIFITPLLILFNKCTIKSIPIPPIDNEILNIPAVDLATKIRNKEVNSFDVVTAYINRIKQVNPIVNAVVTERFQDALRDAVEADAKVNLMESSELRKRYPLLGVPFTVKESCSLKDMAYSVGSYPRKGKIASDDGTAVANLKAAGAIPLLASTTPECCASWETDNFVTGKTLNPHNLRHTSGGSSGGEGALIGSGASVFGIGSDLGGSIRIPALFNGIFGHKPTGGIVSLNGHFPSCSDENFMEYLVIGPMCRYAKDLSTVLEIMAGDNAKKLQLNKSVDVNNLNIFYIKNIGQSLATVPVQNDIKEAMKKAIKHFQSNGQNVQEAVCDIWHETNEISIALFSNIKDLPQICRHPENPKIVDDDRIELLKSIIGLSNYTFKSLAFSVLGNASKSFPKNKLKEYQEKGQQIKKYLLELLGNNGVLLYPTYPTSALHHNDSLNKISGVIYATTFNWLGFPSTHIPLGKDGNGLPVGFQVVAAPYQDRLCLAIANELETTFGGWVKPF